MRVQEWSCGVGFERNFAVVGEISDAKIPFRKNRSS